MDAKVAVACLVDLDGRGARFTGHSLIGEEIVDCGRWATVRDRDRPRGRAYTFTITLSDGTTIEGEFALWWAHHRSCEWVREGR